VAKPAGKPLECDIEAAADEYITARVSVLQALEGNPYQAEVRAQPPLQGLLVASTSSPMMNRICGDVRSSADALMALLPWFAARRCVAAVSLTVSAGKPAAMQRIGMVDLRRWNGWTHTQLAAPIAGLPPTRSPLEVEEVLDETVDFFANIHAKAFHTPAERQASNRASFSGLIADPRAKGFLVRIDGKPVAGAIVYFASNGFAYLGTAATLREARGRGCHSALIGCRIAAARRHGSKFVAATATPNSQSRRNLERLGFVASHLQALYRVALPQHS
jgi:GNAT superfamily N-acetyltransferase